MLRDRGIEEVSLNFATAARFMHSPDEPCRARWSARLAKRLDRFFQIESLYRFNAKFFPRWEPRYAIYEGRFGLPRMALAGMWAEGQLPKPQLARRLPGMAPPGARAFPVRRPDPPRRRADDALTSREPSVTDDRHGGR